MRQGGNHLLRVLGVAFGIAAVIGGTIGQGILRSPGLVAEGVPEPWLIILLWAIGRRASWIDAMSTIELATSIRGTGGPIRSSPVPSGGSPASLTGIADWLGYAGAMAFVSVVLAEYLHRLGIGTTVPISSWRCWRSLRCGGVQALGTRIGGVSQEIGSAVKALIFTA